MKLTFSLISAALTSLRLMLMLLAVEIMVVLRVSLISVSLLEKKLQSDF